MQKILIFLILSFYAIQTNDNVVSITLIEYAQIINEIDSISSNLYNYCIKINYLQSEELKGKCIGYIMQSIHTNMPKSFKTLNINHSDSKITTLGNDLVNIFIKNPNYNIIMKNFKERILIFLNSYGFPEDRENLPIMSNDEIIKLRNELENDCIFLNEYINLSTYIDIISEVLSLSKNIYSYCENIKKNYKNQHEVEGKCIGYIMSNIHLMSISFKTLNINHSDSKIIKLGNDLLELYLSNSYTKFNKTILDFLYSYGLPKLSSQLNEEIDYSISELKKNLIEYINEDTIKENCVFEKINPIYESLFDLYDDKKLLIKDIKNNIVNDGDSGGYKGHLSRRAKSTSNTSNEGGFWAKISKLIENILINNKFFKN